jgi:polysaccharide pyruvyl transferase WcaK-like protein
MFLLVGDNRSNSNWGGRSASMALFALLRRDLGDGASVYGSELLLASAGYGYRSRLFPRSKLWVARSVAVSESRSPLLRSVRGLDRMLGGRDFLAATPERSVRNLLEWRRSDPGLQSLYDRIEQADIVVVNGEGDVVFGRPVRRQIRFFAAMIQLGRMFGKRVVFVNSMLSDCAITGRDPQAFATMAAALRACDVVAVRDVRSLRIARQEMGLQSAAYVPDSLFHWYESQKSARQQLPPNGDFLLPHPEHEYSLGRLDLGGDYICVGGTSFVTQAGARPRVVAAYRRLVASLRELGLPVYLVVADGQDAFLEPIARELDLGLVPLRTPIHFAAAILGRARLLVSGRYHPSIMAALGGTPSLLLETNAHKMSTLAEILESEERTVFSAAPDPSEIDRLRDTAARLLAAGDGLRNRIEATAQRRADEAMQLGRLIAANGREESFGVGSRS